MARIWQSVSLIGMFLLALVLVVLLSPPASSSRDASVSIVKVDARLRERDTGRVSVNKLKMSLNEQEHLEKIPHQIGDWRGTDDDATELIREKLHADVLLMRTYRKDGLSQPLFLVIVHSASVGNLHPPPVCYRARGYSIEEEGEATVPVEYGALRRRIEGQILDATDEQGQRTTGEWIATKLGIPTGTAEIPVSRLLVYKTDGDKIAERRLAYYLYLKDTEFVGYSEFSMLRVSALIPEHDYDHIENEISDFMSEVLALVFGINVEEREPLFGYIAGFGLNGYLVIAALFLLPLAMLVYPLATRKVFSRAEHSEAMARENDDQTKAPDRLAEGAETANERKAVTPSVSMPVSLEETSADDSILAAYYNSQRLVEGATGISATSCPTLRGFLNTVVPELPEEAARRFTELTMITERAMYSAYEPGEATAARSRQLADEIREQLDGDGARYSPA